MTDLRKQAKGPEGIDLIIARAYNNLCDAIRYQERFEFRKALRSMKDVKHIMSPQMKRIKTECQEPLKEESQEKDD